MCLILDLVIIALKEVMKQRKIQAGRSFDILKVTEACTNMKIVETNLVASIKNETKIIKEKTEAIQELINTKIFNLTEFPGSFFEFIEAWHEHNKSHLAEIELRSDAMESIYKKTAELYSRAQQMLQPTSYEIYAPPLALIKEVAEFYENAGVTNETLPKTIHADALNFSWLIAQLHLVLPAIIKYVGNYSLDPSDSSNEELKVLNRLVFEVKKIEAKTDELSTKFKKAIPEMIGKLKKSKLERQQLEEENQTPEELHEKAVKKEIEIEKVKLLTSPRFYFDATTECLKHVVIKKTRLALMNDDEGKENFGNQTKFYRSMRSPFVNRQSKLNQTSMNDMLAPKQQPRRRLDPMELLEKATSNRGRQDLNATTRYTERYTGTIPKQSRQLASKFSSTMLSPELHQPLFNCSTVSEIMKASPVVEVSEKFFDSVCQETVKAQPTTNFDLEFFKRQPKAVNTNPWEDPVLMKSIEMSPKGKLKAIVTADEIFQNPQKMELNGKTVDENLSTSENEKTLINQNSNVSGGAASDSYSFGSIMLPTDEDLFNISDSVLKDIDD